MVAEGRGYEEGGEGGTLVGGGRTLVGGKGPRRGRPTTKTPAGSNQGTQGRRGRGLRGGPHLAPHVSSLSRPSDQSGPEELRLPL